MKALRERFAARCVERREQLAAALTGEDMDEVIRISHELAGNAGLFGYPDLSSAAQRLEEAARAVHRDSGELDRCGEDVLQALDQTITNGAE